MITEEQKDDMLHALGRPNIRKDWKPKTILDKCYRNRYVTYAEEKQLEELIKLGFMKKVIQNQQGCIHDKLYFYYVTEEGVKYLQDNK